MKKTNKYLYVFVVQGRYVVDWEDLIQSEHYREAIADYRCYVQNEPEYSHRIIQRRENNPIDKE